MNETIVKKYAETAKTGDPGVYRPQVVRIVDSATLASVNRMAMGTGALFIAVLCLFVVLVWRGLRR